MDQLTVSADDRNVVKVLKFLPVEQQALVKGFILGVQSKTGLPNPTTPNAQAGNS